jgi:large subunit ribosomal protein L21
MYAIVKTGGKQYKVEAGDYLKVEKLGGDPGDRVDLPEVLAVAGPEGIRVGAPTLPDAVVKATIVRTHKDRKIIVFKKKRRKGYKKRQGHRQWVTVLKIDEITNQPADTVESEMMSEQPVDATPNLPVGETAQEADVSAPPADQPIQREESGSAAVEPKQ